MYVFHSLCFGTAGKAVAVGGTIVGEAGALVAGAFELERLDTVGRGVALGGEVGVTTVGVIVCVFAGVADSVVEAQAETMSRTRIRLNFRIIFHLTQHDNKWTSRQPHEFPFVQQHIGNGLSEHAQSALHLVESRACV
jgi:hypothetical protein